MITWLWAALWLGITNYFGLFLFSGFFWGNPCEDIHPVKTCKINCRKIAFEQELAFYRPVFLQSSCSDSAERKFEKIFGVQNMCHSAIGMEHKLIHGHWVIFGTSLCTVQCFCLRNIIKVLQKVSQKFQYTELQWVLKIYISSRVCILT